MSTGDERAAQRAEWRQALAAAAKAGRQRRGKRAPARVRAGMTRVNPIEPNEGIETEMTIDKKAGNGA